MKLKIIDNKNYKVKELFISKEINKINYVHIDNYAKQLCINNITTFAR